MSRLRPQKSPARLPLPAPPHDPVDVTIRLHKIEDLFVAPDVTPLAPEWQDHAGVEEVYAEFIKDWKSAPGKLTLRLPAAQITPDLHTQVQAAIQRYCDAENRRATLGMTVIRRLGRRNLILGVIVLACLLGASAALTQVTFLPEWLAILLSESCIIAGWVIVWHPIEQLLYEWRPDYVRLRFSEWLRAMRLEIHADA